MSKENKQKQKLEVIAAERAEEAEAIVGADQNNKGNRKCQSLTT